MKSMRLAICDDDIYSLEAVSGSIMSTFNRCGYSPSIDKYSSPLELKDALKEKNYNLIFLDIDMPELDGIALGKIIKDSPNPPEIIFVSAREERVFESLSVHPFGFIRKNSFLVDVSKVVESYCKSKQGEGEEGKALNLVSKGRILSIEIGDISYIDSYRDTQYLHLKGQKDPVNVSSTMEKLDEKLKPHGFIRIHKSILVNYRYISRIESLEVLLVDGTRLELSRRKLQEVRAAYLKLLEDDDSVMVGNV